MPDYGFLLGAQIPQAPNPLALAGQGLTLGHLALGNQMEQLQLQTAQQMAQALPEFYARLSGQGGGGPPGQGGGGPVDVNSVLSDIAQKYPLAGQQLTNMVLGMQEKQANIGEKQALTVKAHQETQNMEMTNIQKLADSYGPNATPQQASAIYQRIRNAGLDPTNFDGSSPGSFVSSVSTGLQDPKVRQDLLQSQATTAKTQAEVGQMPAELAVKQSQAASSALTAQTGRLKYLGGDQVEDNNTGDRYQVAPDPNDPTRMVATLIYKAKPGQAPGPSSEPSATVNLQGKVTPTQLRGIASDMEQQQPSAPPQPFTPGIPAPKKEMMVENAKTAASLESALPSAYEGLASVQRMRTAINSGQGIYSGPVKGSEFFKSLAGVLSQMPGASENMLAKVTNTQAWEAEGGELAFNMLSSLKGSVPRAQSALNQIRSIKPNTMMTTDAQNKVLDAIEERFNDQITFTRNAAKTIGSGKTLSDVPMPPGAVKGAGSVKSNPDGSWSIDLTQ